MFKYDILVKKPSHFRNFSGVEVNEFNALNSKIKEKYPAYEQKRLSREDRKNKIGAGHPFKLSLTNRLLILLVYYHMYVSSTMCGYLFDLSQTNVLKDIRKLEPLVSEILPLPKQQNDKVKRLETIDEIEAMFPGAKAFLDATEQEIPRPKPSISKRRITAAKRKAHRKNPDNSE